MDADPRQPLLNYRGAIPYSQENHVTNLGYQQTNGQDYQPHHAYVGIGNPPQTQLPGHVQYQYGAAGFDPAPATGYGPPPTTAGYGPPPAPLPDPPNYNPEVQDMQVLNYPPPDPGMLVKAEIKKLKESGDFQGVEMRSKNRSNIPDPIEDSRFRKLTVPVPKMAVNSHFSLSLCLCITWSVLLMWPAAIFAAIALGFAYHSQKLIKIDSYDKAKSQGKTACLCSVISLAVASVYGMLALAVPMGVYIYYFGNITTNTTYVDDTNHFDGTIVMDS